MLHWNHKLPAVVVVALAIAVAVGRAAPIGFFW